MNVKKVLISNNDSLIWTTDNVLFWKKLLKDVKDIEIVDKDSFSPNPNVKKGEYDLTIVSTLDLPESRIKLNDITSTSSDTAKGVYLDSNGLMVYTFNSKKEALEVQNIFLPKSIYKDKSLFVTFEGSIKNLDIKKEVDIIFYIAPPVNQNELLLTLQNTPSNWSLYEPQLVQPPIIYSSIEEDIISNWRQLVGEIEVLWTKYFYKVSTWVSYINDLYWKEESDIWNGSLWNLIQLDNGAFVLWAHNKLVYSKRWYWAILEVDSSSITTSTVWNNITSPLIPWAGITTYSQDKKKIIYGNAPIWIMYDVETGIHTKIYQMYAANHKFTNNSKYLWLTAYGNFYIRDNNDLSNNTSMYWTQLFSWWRVISYDFTSNNTQYVYVNSSDNYIYLKNISDTTLNSIGIKIWNTQASSVKVMDDWNITFVWLNDWLTYKL